MGKQKSADLSAEELEIRAKEDALFEKLRANPPSVLEGVMDILGDESKSKAIARQRSNDKKLRIEREENSIIEIEIEANKGINNRNK